MMLHHSFHHTHIWYELLRKGEDTICEIKIFHVVGTDSYQQGDIITTYSISTIVIRMCDIGFSDRFCRFSGQLFFIVT